MVTADPDDDRAYALLAMTLAATGAPLEAVHEALRTREALIGAEGGAAPRLRDEAQLASFAGDFVTAEARLRELEALPDAEYGGMAHEEALELLLLYEQTGQTDEALAVAEKYLQRFAGWPHGFYGRARPVALALLRRQGLVSEAQFTSERRDWEREERDKNLPIEQNLAWFDYEARLTRTPEEALGALAVLPESLPLPKPKGLHWNDDPIYLQHQEGMGRTYLLGGRPRDAREPLALVTRSCMGLGEPWAYVEAYEELGQALEALNDPAGACRAYAAVLTRWGNARPRSSSAEEARKRMAALHCA
jgi:eukaryotic-like serine/threonine-protein kinase